MSRLINGLKWAKALADRPKCLGAAKRVSGAKLAGLRYERALAKALPKGFIHGQWWEFEDREGHGFCQTDFIFPQQDWVVVLEVKYTWTADAEDQLWGLYLPVVEMALRKHVVIPVVVCKKLVPGCQRPVSAELLRAVETSYELASAISGCAVWHHLGGVPRLGAKSPTPLDNRVGLSQP